MSRELKQIRWVGQAGEPSNVTFSGLTDTDHLSGLSAIQLGIQAPEGTIFYVDEEKEHPIAVGRTGIFEWSVEGTGAYITHFSFGNLSNDDQSNTYIADFYLKT